MVTSELQEIVMLTRMQPVGNVVNKFSRVIRDMARELGKQIDLRVSGKEVEMDKTIIEGLSNPLTHLVRNAVDHGIEAPADRVRLGKPSRGTVDINFCHKAGQVVIEIKDDGNGIDVRKVTKAALAIIPSLLVSIEGDKYTIPQVNVREMISVAADQVKERIEVVGDAEALKVRGELIPIMHLASVLGIQRTYVGADGERYPERRLRLADRRLTRAKQSGTGISGAASKSARRSSPRSALNTVVVTVGALKYALVVEELHETVEIVVKPLGRHLKGSREYTGATILGDGKVALILDIAGIAEKAGLASMAASAQTQEPVDDEAVADSTEAHAFLLFHNGQDHCAVPLGLVARVERVKAAQVRTLAGRRTVRYRGGSLPLVALSDAVGVEELAGDEDPVVIIFEVSGNEIGLLATEPVDIVEAEVAIDELALRQTGIFWVQQSSKVALRWLWISSAWSGRRILSGSRQPRRRLLQDPRRLSACYWPRTPPSSETRSRNSWKRPTMKLSPPKTASGHGII